MQQRALQQPAAAASIGGFHALHASHAFGQASQGGMVSSAAHPGMHPGTMAQPQAGPVASGPQNVSPEEFNQMLTQAHEAYRAHDFNRALQLCQSVRLPARGHLLGDPGSREARLFVQDGAWSVMVATCLLHFWEPMTELCLPDCLADVSR